MRALWLMLAFVSGCSTSVDCAGDALPASLAACSDALAGKAVCPMQGAGYRCQNGCWAAFMDGPCGAGFRTDAGVSCSETEPCNAEGATHCTEGLQFTCSGGCDVPTSTCSG